MHKEIKDGPDAASIFRDTRSLFRGAECRGGTDTHDFNRETGSAKVIRDSGNCSHFILGRGLQLGVPVRRIAAARVCQDADKRHAIFQMSGYLKNFRASRFQAGTMSIAVNFNQYPKTGASCPRIAAHGIGRLNAVENDLAVSPRLINPINAGQFMRGDSDRVNQICDSVGGKKFRLFQGGNCGGTSRVLNLETGNFQTLMRFQMRTPMHTELRAGCFGSGNIPDKFVAINQKRRCIELGELHRRGLEEEKENLFFILPHPR